MRILYSIWVLPEQGTALESSSTGGREFFGELCCGCVDADWNIWRRSSKGGIPVEGGREKGSTLLRECNVFWKCQLFIYFSWAGCEKGDELTDFVKPFLPHFLTKILSQNFCAHYVYLFSSATTYWRMNISSRRSRHATYTLRLLGLSQYLQWNIPLVYHISKRVTSSPRSWHHRLNRSRRRSSSSESNQWLTADDKRAKWWIWGIASCWRWYNIHAGSVEILEGRTWSAASR